MIGKGMEKEMGEYEFIRLIQSRKVTCEKAEQLDRKPQSDSDSGKGPRSS